ncbi:MAG: hypothetical protein ACHQ4H_17115 [Ktedonobacterales bacterium]
MQRSRWRNWQQVALIGLILGLLELGLFVFTVKFSQRLSPPQAVLFGLPLYVLLPALAGFQLGSRHRQEAAGGVLTGMWVGLVSMGIVIVGAGLWLGVGVARNMIAPPAPTHLQGRYSPGRYSPTLDIVVSVVVWIFLGSLNIFGVVLSMVGGLVGGLAARWLAKAHVESRPAHRDL